MHAQDSVHTSSQLYRELNANLTCTESRDQHWLPAVQILAKCHEGHLSLSISLADEANPVCAELRLAIIFTLFLLIQSLIPCARIQMSHYTKPPPSLSVQISIHTCTWRIFTKILHPYQSVISVTLMSAMTMNSNSRLLTQTYLQPYWSKFMNSFWPNGQRPVTFSTLCWHLFEIPTLVWYMLPRIPPACTHAAKINPDLFPMQPSLLTWQITSNCFICSNFCPERFEIQNWINHFLLKFGKLSPFILVNTHVTFVAGLFNIFFSLSLLETELCTCVLIFLMAGNKM